MRLNEHFAQIMGQISINRSPLIHKQCVFSNISIREAKINGLQHHYSTPVLIAKTNMTRFNSSQFTSNPPARNFNRKKNPRALIVDSWDIQLRNATKYKLHGYPPGYCGKEKNSSTYSVIQVSREFS